MALLRRRAILPDPVRRALRSRCREVGIDGGRMLAQAPGVGEGEQQQWAVALPTHLAYGSADTWTFVPWHEVDRGSWNADTSTLEIDQRGTVTDGLVHPGGRRHRVPLRHPQRVPEVMAERVAATILFHRQVPVPDSAAVLTVTARRDLADERLIWLAVPNRRLRADDPDVQAFADAMVRRFRQEFE